MSGSVTTQSTATDSPVAPSATSPPRTVARVAPMNSIPAAANRRATLSLPRSPKSVRGRSSGVTRRSWAPSTLLRASSRPVMSASSYSGKSHPAMLGATNAALRTSPLRSRLSMSFTAWLDPASPNVIASAKRRSRPRAGGQDQSLEVEVRPARAADPVLGGGHLRRRSRGRTPHRTRRRFPAGNSALLIRPQTAPPPSGAGRRTNRPARRGSQRRDRRRELAGRSAPPGPPHRRRRSRPGRRWSSGLRSCKPPYSISAGLLAHRTVGGPRAEFRACG